MKNIQVLMVLLPLVVVSPLAVASVEGLDLTFDLGSAKQKTRWFSDNDSSYALTLGYELSANWSLNLSYTDFGKARMYSGTLIADGASYDFDRTMENTGIGLAAQYLSDPLLAGWSFGGRLGLIQVDSKIALVAPGYTDTYPSADKDSSTSLIAGLLTSYRLTEQLNLIISADYLAPEVQTASYIAEDIKTTRFALGLNYHF